MKIQIENVNVKFKFIENKNLKAIANLDFGEFTIKGFRIRSSQYKNDFGDNLWISPPCYQDKNGKYHPMFYIPNTDIWEEVEVKIWEEYYDKRKEHNKKKYGLEDEDF